VLEHEWKLELAAPLTVTAAHTDCGCTLAQLEVLRPGPVGGEERSAYEFGSPLAAGATLVVHARYDTRGRLGPSQRSVTLTHSAGAPRALTLLADVRPWLVCQPERFGFTRLRSGIGAESSFRVTSALGERFRLRATGRALPPAVRVTLRPEDADDSGRALTWTGTAVLGPDTPRGTHSYPLERESDVVIPGSEAAGGEPRRFTIAPPWDVQIVGPVALSSPSLEFGLVRADETVARTVRLESFDDGFVLDHPSARLEPLHPTDPFPLERTASVRGRPVPEHAAYDFELLLAGLDPAVSGTFVARLVVETGHPDLPRLEALVRGVRAPESEAPR